MGVPDKSTDIVKGLFSYLTAQDTFVSSTISTSDRAISSHDSYRHFNPISDARISVLLAPSHSCLDSETWWTGELWSKTNLLEWQN